MYKYWNVYDPLEMQLQCKYDDSIVSHTWLFLISVRKEHREASGTSSQSQFTTRIGIPLTEWSQDIQSMLHSGPKSFVYPDIQKVGMHIRDMIINHGISTSSLGIDESFITCCLYAASGRRDCQVLVNTPNIWVVKWTVLLRLDPITDA